MIADADRTRLLTLARRALTAQIERLALPDLPDDLHLTAAGVFITVYCRGELRGCLGALEGVERVAELVRRLSCEVAHADHRFEPLRLDELREVTLDVSVLTPPQMVADASEIVVGRDGLIVESGRHRGLLLPQVATEHRWNRETFLEHTCVKAGLARDAWRRGATIFRFEAEVFGEGGPPAAIER
jgi:AmmeMemoRadiSam system protein A